MDEDIKKLNDEKANLNTSLQRLEQQKNSILTRLIEIQGVIKYLTSKHSESKLKESKVENNSN